MILICLLKTKGGVPSKELKIEEREWWVKQGPEVGGGWGVHSTEVG